MSDILEKRLCEDDANLTMPSDCPQDDMYLSIVHVSLKLWGDFLHQGGFYVFEEHATKCLPDSVYKFCNCFYFFFGGGSNTSEQDIIFVLSDGINIGTRVKNNTKQHVPKKLECFFFNKAGHIIIIIYFNSNAGELVHFTANNIDKCINDGTLEEKDRFHVTQMVAWQTAGTPDYIYLMTTAHLRQKYTPDMITIFRIWERSTPRKESALANDIFPD